MSRLIFLFVLVVSFSSCKEDPVVCASELPCFEVEQNNFLACYLNGKPWRASNETFFNGISAYRAFLINGERFLLHGAKIDQENSTQFEILFHDINGLGKYTNIDLDRHKDLQDRNSPCLELGFGTDYRINQDYNNYLELIEIDTFTNVIPTGYSGYKGYFGIQFINQECRDTITMTEGIFRIGYKG